MSQPKPGTMKSGTVWLAGAPSAASDITERPIQATPARSAVLNMGELPSGQRFQWIPYSGFRREGRPGQFVLQVVGLQKLESHALRHRFGAARYNQLAHQRFHMELDRVERDAEMRSDLLVGQTIGDIAQHFEL